jgi:hypothetical protein
MIQKEIHIEKPNRDHFTCYFKRMFNANIDDGNSLSEKKSKKKAQLNMTGDEYRLNTSLDRNCDQFKDQTGKQQWLTIYNTL